MANSGLGTVIRFALFAAISAVIGAYLTDLGVETREPPGLVMILTGIWFGLAILAGLATLGYHSIKTAIVVFLMTLLGWEAAYNLAFLIAYYINDYGAAKGGAGELVGGFAAGAVGATFTWAGAAFAVSGMRAPRIALKIALTGAVPGFLLRFVVVDNYNLMLLLLPWQTAVAAVLGYFLAQAGANRNSRGNVR